jgi:MFS family permease
MQKKASNRLKLVFALEYVLQGLVNPFQGITYQPFLRFLHDFGMDAAASQGLFAKSYLAWSFKPALGFLMDAYGKTRTALIVLLAVSAAGFLLTPLVGTGPLAFFGMMVAVSVVLAATDVAVDRATVILGADEAAATGRPRSTTVGLNQAICWLSIYGTAVVASVAGGYLADVKVSSRIFIPALALVPLGVLVAVLRLPRDAAAVTVPLRRSIAAFWRGLNSGPVLGVLVFFFVFFFQPSLGPLWNDHLLRDLGFSKSQAGIGDAAAYVGYFLGVLFFTWKGVKWQERFGLRKVFRVYIITSAVLYLSLYLLVDPLFSSIVGALSFLGRDTARMGLMCACNIVLYFGVSLTRMASFSLAGAVIPVAAAGSLFAGMMSINNLAYSFSYASGAWLSQHGMELGPLRSVQSAVFGIGGAPGQPLSLQMLILIGSVAFVASFAVVRLLPDRRTTLASDVAEPSQEAALSRRLRISVNAGALALGVALLLVATLRWKLDPVSGFLMSFFTVVMIRWLVVVGLAKTVVEKPG